MTWLEINGAATPLQNHAFMALATTLLMLLYIYIYIYIKRHRQKLIPYNVKL